MLTKLSLTQRLVSGRCTESEAHRANDRKRHTTSHIQRAAQSDWLMGWWPDWRLVNRYDEPEGDIDFELYKEEGCYEGFEVRSSLPCCVHLLSTLLYYTQPLSAVHEQYIEGY